MAFLVIDDDEAVRESLADVLDEMDGPVLTAADGAGGLAALRDHRPRAVFLDVWLPHAVSAADVISYVRSAPHLRDVPVITMSGAPLPPGTDSNVHLSKPFGMDELVAALKAAAVSVE